MVHALAQLISIDFLMQLLEGWCWRGGEKECNLLFCTSWILNPYLKTTLDFRPNNCACNYIKQLKKKLVNDVQHK